MASPRASRVLAALAAAALLPRAAAAEAPVADFTRHPRYVDVRLSPGGTYVAALHMESGRRSLVFVEVATRKAIWALRPEGDSTVGAFHWANDRRVVVDMVDQDLALAAPVSRGELYAVDADGKNGQVIYGYRAGERQIGSHIKRRESSYAWAQVVGPITGDPRRVLVATREMREVGDRTVTLSKLDVYTGALTLVTRSPVPECEFLTDDLGEARVCASLDGDLRQRFHYREPGQPWRELPAAPFARASSPARVAAAADLAPLGFLARGREIVIVEHDGEAFVTSAVNVETGARRVLSRNALVPPRSLWRDRRATPVLVDYEPDVPMHDFVAPEHPAARALRAVLAARPDEHAFPVNATADEAKVLVFLYGDRHPGEWLLVDTESLKADSLFQQRPWFDPEQMAEMNAFHISASDGLRIHGYVTLPRRAEGAAPPPLVVMPHGGPHFVRDHWRFDPEVQLLASRGFAVLQVNYRGSGGYGRAFEAAGFRAWGDRVVQDIADATRWAVKKGYADPRRICTYGASFGGYAAVQLAVVAPELVRCAVGYAGVYDLERLREMGDAADSRLGQAFARTALGDDAARLRAMSPVHEADRIQVPVLLVHGEKDARAPIAQAEALRKALEQRGRRVEWLVEPREAHGFYDEGARERMWRRVLAFLEEHTAPPKAGATAP